MDCNHIPSCAACRGLISDSKLLYTSQSFLEVVCVINVRLPVSFPPQEPHQHVILYG